MLWYRAFWWTTFVQASGALFGGLLEDTGCRLLGRTFKSPQAFQELPEHCLMVTCLGVHTGLQHLPSCQCLVNGEERRPPSSEGDWRSEITLHVVQESHRIGNLKYDVADWRTVNTNWHRTPNSVHGVETGDPEWVETFDAGTKGWSIMSKAVKRYLEDLEHYIKFQGQDTHLHDMVASNEEGTSNREAGRDIVRAKISLYKFWNNSEESNVHLGRYGSTAQSLVRYSVSQSRNDSSSMSKSSKISKKFTVPQDSRRSKVDAFGFDYDQVKPKLKRSAVPEFRVLGSWVDGHKQIDQDATSGYLGQLYPSSSHGAPGKHSAEDRLLRARRMTLAEDANSGWDCPVTGMGMTKTLVDHCLMVECFRGSGGGQILRSLPDCTCTRTKVAVDQHEINEFLVGVNVDERNMRQKVFSLENHSTSFETFQQIVQRNSDEILKYESSKDTLNTTRIVSEHALEMRSGENNETQSNKTEVMNKYGSGNGNRSSVFVGMEESEYITFNETLNYLMEIWTVLLGNAGSDSSGVSVSTFNDSYRSEEVNLKSEFFPKPSSSIPTTLSNFTASLEQSTSSPLPINESTESLSLSTINVSSSVDQEATTFFSEFLELFNSTTSSPSMKTSEFDQMESTKPQQTSDIKSQQPQNNREFDNSSSTAKVENVFPSRVKPVSILFSGQFNKWTNDRLLTQNQILSSQIQETSLVQAANVTTSNPFYFPPSVTDHAFSSNEKGTPSVKNTSGEKDFVVSGKAIALNTTVIIDGPVSRDSQTFRRIVLSLPLNSGDGDAEFAGADLVDYLNADFADSRLTRVKYGAYNTGQSYHNNHAGQNKHTHIGLNIQGHFNNDTRPGPNIDSFIGLNIQRPSPNDSQVGQRVHDNFQSSTNGHSSDAIQSTQRLHGPFGVNTHQLASNVSQSNQSVHSHIGLSNQREPNSESETYQTSHGQIGLDSQRQHDIDGKTYKSLHSHIGLKNERSSYKVGQSLQNVRSLIGQNKQGQSYDDSQRRRMQQNNREIEKINQILENPSGQEISTSQLGKPGNILAASPYSKSVLNPTNHIIYFNAASYEEKVANSASAFSGKDGQ